jgi:transcriptional regulator with XRE-family HTH domain
MKEQRETLIKFGLKLKLERMKQNLSQEELAALAEMNTASISLIETAKQNIKLSSIKSIADALNLKMSDLVDIENI